MQDKKNLDNIDQEVKDEVGGAIDKFNVSKKIGGSNKWAQPNTDSSTQAFWGGKTQEVDPTRKQGRGTHMNIINYYNSGGSMGEMPKGWTKDDVNEYIKNLNNGTLQKSQEKKVKSNIQVAHYEPQGTMIKETTMKRIAKWNSKFQYKDKPAGTDDGFPDTPPPKLKNGWHPEYGKVDNRYNRLDPISARSMPKTGEASIDKKVEKAKKKKK